MDNIINTLSGNWSLYYEENSKCANFAYDISSIDDLNKQGFKNLNCTVPGNFVLDLYKNGLIPDPFWGDNAIKLQYLETMHVWYSSKFEINTVDSYLFFGGLDTICDIYIDGKFVLHADNMFTPFKTPVLEMGKHEIVIHFIPPVIEAKKHTIPAASNALWYNYQSMYIRKSAHSFGWDILPRIISCGVWKPIDIMQKKQDSINDVFVYTLYTKPTEKIAKIRMFFDVTTSDDLIQNYRIRFSGNCGDSSFCDEMTIWGNQYSRMAFEIKNAKLWWPRGYGEQNLYQCKAELIKDGTVLDTYNITIGLRTIELDRTDSVKDSSGQFLFKINGEPIFWRGVNWVPLSPYACENEGRLSSVLENLLSTNSNAVRMWGGGIYESEAFFDFCDKHGIMVWQDFMMACCVYPEDHEFMDQLEKEAVYQIKRLRSRASLILWSGDNECDCTYNTWGGIVRNPNENRITRKLLPELIQMHDFSRPFLPSSPYISDECFKLGLTPPEDHLWGNRPYFKNDFYVKSQCYFVSEIGYPGIASPETLNKYIGEEYMFPVFNEDGSVNAHWEAHGTETMLTKDESPYKNRVPMIMGKIKDMYGYIPDNINDLSKHSQIIQAEAVKAFIENFRSHKWRRTGIIYWNLQDGWPMSSEAVFDYYGTKKLAYHYMRRSYEPICLMVNDSDDKKTLVASNDTLGEANISYTIKDVETSKELCSGTLVSKQNSCVAICDISLPKSDSMIIIEWEINGVKYQNHYYGNTSHFDYNHYLSLISKIGFDEFSGY